MTKLTDLTYQGRRAIGPFGPNDKPVRAGWYPASEDKRRASHRASLVVDSNNSVESLSNFWNGEQWQFDELSDSPDINQYQFWFALEDEK